MIIIYNELCLGVISNESKQQYLDIIGDLVKSGVQGVILGCTELGYLLNKMIRIYLYLILH